MSEGGSGPFCVLCGATGRTLYGAICAECLGKKVKLVSIPQRVEVVICPRCGSRNVGKHWERGPPPGLFRSEDLDRHLTVERPAILRGTNWKEAASRAPLGPGVRAFQGEIDLDVGGTAIKGNLATEVKEIHHTCPHCSRREGSYYTAILQFRPSLEGRPRRSMEEFKNATHGLWVDFEKNAPRNWREALAWEEELKEGWDVYLMDTAVAKTMTKSLKQITGASTKESATLWGIKDGRKTYRVTFLLRFPPMIPGDVFEHDGELLRVSVQDEEKIRVTSSRGGEPRSMLARDLLDHYRFIGGRDRMGRWTVANRTPLQVADPESGEAHRVEGPAPSDLELGQEVAILRDGERTWIVPDAFRRGRSR